MKPLHSRTLMRLRWPLAISCAALLTALLLWGLVVRYDIKLSTETLAQMPLVARLRQATQTAAAPRDTGAAAGAAQTATRQPIASAQVNSPASAELGPQNQPIMSSPAPSASTTAPISADTKPSTAAGSGLAWPPHSGSSSSAGLGTGNSNSLSAGAGQGSANQGDDASAACFVQARPTSTDYPPRAIDDNIRRGRVSVRLFINADGIVDKTQVVSAQPVGYFERAAQRLALRWRCEPRGSAYSLIAPIEFELR